MKPRMYKQAEGVVSGAVSGERPGRRSWHRLTVHATRHLHVVLAINSIFLSGPE